MEKFIIECKQCGAEIEVEEGKQVAACRYCGSTNTMPKSGESTSNLFNRANYLRRNNEFDKAMDAYEELLKQDDTEAETYWGMVLCKYGIEYVEDPQSGERIPTCHRTQFDSILNDDNYKKALEYSSYDVRAVYEDEARKIDNIQKKILEMSSKEEPFDIFICYKETGNNGERTEDSVLAQDIYYELEKKGYKTFFARKTLENKLGDAYEPIIFAALNSSKVMLVLGTSPDYFNAVWVKNEWSRFIEIIRKGDKKTLIPAYKNMSPYDMPKEFSNLQALDMGKLGFMQDLCDGIDKLINVADKTASQPQNVSRQQEAKEGTPESLLERGYIFLEDGDFASADKYFEKVLDKNPEEARAYIGKLLAELKLTSKDKLASNACELTKYNNFNKAVRFATKEEKKEYMGYNQAILDRLEKERTESERLAAIEREKERKEAEKARAARKAFHKFLLVAIPAIIVLCIIVHFARQSGNYSAAEKYISNGKVEEALQTINKIGDKDKVKTLYSQLSDYCNNKGLKSAADGDVNNARYYLGIAYGKGKYPYEQKTISSLEKHIVGLKKDGTVIAVGDNTKGECDVSKWKDIIAVSAGNNFTAGLKKDGTVVAVGDNSFGQCNVSSWKNIVSISAGEMNLLGLKRDGTVVIAGDAPSDNKISDWKDIVAISAGNDFIAGLKRDGTVVTEGNNTEMKTSDWKDIVAISTGYLSMIGLKKDGTVVIAGDNILGDDYASKWKDIIAISMSSTQAIGLKKDGTVVATSNTILGNINVSGWKDIADVSAGDKYVTGLRKDGTILIAASNKKEQYNVSDWKDILVRDILEGVK